jgi:hypothetical protein
MNNIQKCQEAEKQGLRVQYNNPVSNTWVDGSWVYWEIGDRYRIHPDDLHKFIDPELKTENPEKISESSGNSQEFMEILTDFQKTLLKSSKDFKLSYETQGGKIKIQIEFSKDSVKQEDEGWISNVGNSTKTWPEGTVQCSDTLQIVSRSGKVQTIPARDLQSSIRWWETDKCQMDIVKFRIIKS